MHHIGEGKHGARSTKQAIAIGLSKARRAGVNLRLPGKGKASAQTRRAKSASRRSQSGRRPSPSRSRAVLGALRAEGRSAHEAVAGSCASALPIVMATASAPERYRVS